MGFAGERELDDDAMNATIGIGLLDFGGDIGGGFGEVVDNGDADVFAVFDFEVDVFLNDRVVVVADDEEGGGLR